ncbi:hypothetical protein OG723_35860 [Streptomyces sp. NBC_01278]|uniref:hypothetical protein n=1 Tax=Streptomyces sp. NBC_01278 TaxID=2903809 RepID=UPI002E2FBA98|nr:hypothetical protein [Streptomyces sp. NBC_01278]
MATPIVPADLLEVVFMASPETAPPTAGSIKRVVAASLVGTTIEWYDHSSDQSYHLRLFGAQGD